MDSEVILFGSFLSFLGEWKGNVEFRIDVQARRFTYAISFWGLVSDYFWWSFWNLSLFVDCRPLLSILRNFVQNCWSMTIEDGFFNVTEAPSWEPKALKGIVLERHSKVISFCPCCKFEQDIDGQVLSCQSGWALEFSQWLVPESSRFGFLSVS